MLDELFERINAYINENSNNSKSLINYKSPAELTNIIDLSIDKEGVSDKEFFQLMDHYLKYSVRTGNKQFFNQLYSGFNLPAFIGDVCTALTNTSMYTYEVAPVASLIETEMIKLMNNYTGYIDGDGTFVTGGSNANLIAMLTARNLFLPTASTAGYDRSSRLTVFVNEYAHYSFDTAANIIGIGSTHVIKVKADSNGRMLVAELELAISASIDRGEKPFFVAATCGTTIMGAYDPLAAISAICDKYQLWFHADGSFGGTLLLSEQHRHLLDGIEHTDSFAWNPHKLMNIPLVCSALLIKKKGQLSKNLTEINTDYIYHDREEIEDLGKKSIQCGRSVDAVKLWFAWKYFGLEGYQKRIDNLIEMAKYAESIIIENPRLQLLVPRQSFTLCFRYKPINQHDENEFNLTLREMLRKSGITLVNFATINNLTAIRLVTANADLEQLDIDLFFKHIIDGAELLES